MSNVLLISLNYAPEPVGIGPYSAGLAESLVTRGHRVQAIVGKPYYPQWRVYDGYIGPGWLQSEECGVSVTRCPHYVPSDPIGPKRILHLATFALAALPHALRAALRCRTERPEVVMVVAPALLSVVTAWAAARIAGAKLWIHVQDFEVEAALATGLLAEQGLPERFARWLEGWVLRRGDRVSTISPQMCAKLRDKGVPPERVLEVRNWADARFAPDPDGARSIRAEWQLGERVVALYSGNIARKQGIEILVEAAQRLRQRKDIGFVICGEGPNRAELERLTGDLDNIQLHNLQPPERMGAMLTMADLHLLPQIVGAADLVLPSKLTNMLASGRPVVATAEPGTGLHAEVDGCGTLTPPGEAAALADAIARLADDPGHRDRLGKAARQRAEQRWMKPAIIDRIEAELAALTS